MTFTEIHCLKALEAYIGEKKSLKNVVVQNIDASSVEAQLQENDVDVSEAVFLGCTLSKDTALSLIKRGAILFPKLENLPFNPYRSSLYSRDDLFSNFDPADGKHCTYCDTLDAKIYSHWRKKGKSNPSSLMEALARRLHDFSMTDALNEFVSSHKKEVKDENKVVAIMGGHAMKRCEDAYRNVVEISRQLTQAGYLMISGGGPGGDGGNPFGCDVRL